jgi:hypothetical protein
MVWQELYSETPDDAYKRRDLQVDLPIDDFTARASLVIRAAEIIFERRPRPIKDAAMKPTLFEEEIEIEIIGEPGVGLTPAEDLIKNILEQAKKIIKTNSLAPSKYRMELHRKRMSSVEKEEAKRKNLIQKANAKKKMTVEEITAADNSHRLAMQASRQNRSEAEKELIRQKDRERKATKVIEK